MRRSPRNSLRYKLYTRSASFISVAHRNNQHPTETGRYSRGGAGLIGGRHERTPLTFVLRLKTLSPLVTYISSKFAELDIRQRHPLGRGNNRVAFADLIEDLHAKRGGDVDAPLRIDRHAIRGAARRRIRHVHVEVALLVGQRAIRLNLEDPRAARRNPTRRAA